MPGPTAQLRRGESMQPPSLDKQPELGVAHSAVSGQRDRETAAQEVREEKRESARGRKKRRVAGRGVD